MITKETFCAALGQIMEQREIDEKVGAALESVGDGHFVFGCNNRYLTALLLVLKEAVNDQYDYIDWWLYDASPDYKVWTDDGTNAGAVSCFSAVSYALSMKLSCFLQGQETGALQGVQRLCRIFGQGTN